MAPMTVQQVQAVQSDWSKLAPDAASANGVGQLILFALYRQHPAVKPLFTFLKKEHTEDEMANMPRFKLHVESLSKYLTQAIQSLNDQQETSRLFRKVATIHIRRNVKSEHAVALVEALVTVLKSALGSDTDLSHWVAFSQFITADFADVVDGKVTVDREGNLK